MLLLLAGFMYFGKAWGGNITNLLFANRSLATTSTGLAINSHWFWAIAMFVAPAVAYNWGILGLLYFVIPNALSLLVVATLTHRLRDHYPDGYSLTEYIKENFSTRISVLYQIIFAGISLMGILLGFTAITKYFAFAGLGSVIDPIYASLIVGLITVAFTVRGGIRTSIYAGAIQTVLWALFIGVMVLGYGVDISYGKNELTTIFDEKFMTTFGIAYLGTTLIGASNHGMMWQKAFSMPKENIFPSFSLAAIIFGLLVFGLGSFGLYAQAHGLAVTAPDMASLAGILDLYGPMAIVAFGVLLIGQTSTVMDSCMNYISSLVGREWLKKDDTLVARLIMLVFFVAAWMISWLKVEVWTIFMLMGAARISMFLPLVLQVYQTKLKENIVFYSSIVAISGAVYLSYTARMLKNPQYDMYSILFGLGVAGVTCLVAKLAYKNKE